MSADVKVSSAQGRGVLAATILGSGMAFLDGTIINVATVKIGEEFSASFGQLQWVLNSYALALASLILLGGSLGDRFGRRRTFVIGVGWFALASLLCAVAPNVETLIAARALQGIGGALLTPGSLAIISASFAPGERGRAIGRWSGLAGVSTAIGPLLGGWLVQSVSWRAAFGINIPLAVLVIWLTMRHVPESHAEHIPDSYDIPGLFTIAAALGFLTYGTTEAGSTGWGAVAISCCVAAVVFMGLYFLNERRTSSPVVPLDLFTNRVFAGANVMTFLTYAALGTFFFVLVLHLQVTAGYSPLTAGLALVPITLLMMFFSSRAGAGGGGGGARLPMTVGPLLAAIGLFLTRRIGAEHHNYLTDVFPGVLIFGIGLTCLVAPLTAAVMAAAPPDEVGVASGINNAVSRAASLLAVAAIPALAGLQGSNYLDPVAMKSGYDAVALVGAAILVLAAIVVVFTIPAKPMAAPQQTPQLNA